MIQQEKKLKRTGIALVIQFIAIAALMAPFHELQYNLGWTWITGLLSQSIYAMTILHSFINI